MYKLLTKLQTSGRDISKTVRNIKKTFSMILIYINIIISTKFNFCGHVPLNDSWGFKEQQSELLVPAQIKEWYQNLTSFVKKIHLWKFQVNTTSGSQDMIELLILPKNLVFKFWYIYNMDLSCLLRSHFGIHFNFETQIAIVI